MLIIVSGFACCAGLLYLDGLRFNADSDPSGWYSGLQYG
jgi:hypothetical protein